MTYHLSDFYDSTVIESHFTNRRSKALAFLHAIGAKAIVLAASSKSAQDAVRGLNAEFSVKTSMIREAAFQRLHRDLTEQPGLTVFKKARNGVLRSVNIRSE
jgi:hypothetical protein